jgi:hypothetical protein
LPDGLIRDADGWRNAADIRAYIEAARQAIGDQAGAQAFEAWPRWALAEADKLDPLISGTAGRMSLDSMSCRAPIALERPCGTVGWWG